MKRNEGFSLVELIVIIAIIAILGTVAFAGVGMLTGWNINKCVEILDGGLSQKRVSAMSKSASYLTITRDADGNYYMELTGSPREKIASGNISITYATQVDGTSETVEGIEITTTNPLILTYDRASGAFAPIVESYNLQNGDCNYVTSGEGAESRDVYCISLEISAGDSKNVMIRLVRSTGRHSIE